ncbi:hypothetical protein BJ508DRAFT_364086 [Ascobolus immersus RN42]|uniref:CBM-cenC domain-containing protein n=1 Tax=Ascobolus immersus RN42 TaxID=1160509 RepID=A0A3N4I891_ASCIM|nr:hypothetical protein BJ508DRAFT_364086 [Ascobolus immersus RN42]
MKFTILLPFVLATFATATPNLEERHHDDRWCPKGKIVTKTVLVTKARSTITSIRTKHVTSTKHWCKKDDWHWRKTVTKTNTVIRTSTASSTSTVVYTETATSTAPAITQTTTLAAPPSALTKTTTVTDTPSPITVTSTEVASAVTITIISTSTAEASTVTKTVTGTPDTETSSTSATPETTDPPAPTCSKPISAIQNGDMETASPLVWGYRLTEGVASGNIFGNLETNARSGASAYRLIADKRIGRPESALEIHQAGSFCVGETYRAEAWVTQNHPLLTCTVKLRIGSKLLADVILPSTGYAKISGVEFVAEAETDEVVIGVKCVGESSTQGNLRITDIDDVVVERIV